MNLNLEATRKIMRVVIVAIIFVAMVSLVGIKDMRQANQLVFMLAMISLFSLMLANIWVTLFLAWTVFLYAFFKFDSGSVYLSNIFFGCILYFITRIAFKKEHIDLFINGFLWFVFANVFYMAIQAVGYDFIYKQITFHGFTEYIDNTLVRGFMGNASISGMLMAFAIPILASRGSKIAWVGSVGLFLPLYLSHTSLCFLMGIVGLLFILYFKIPKKMWIAGLVPLILCGSLYLAKVDGFGVERFHVWKRIMRDVMIHPITGWGLDSFANVTKQKTFRYSNSVTKVGAYTANDGKVYKNITQIHWWGNPHNIILSILYEFSFVGLFLFIGYTRRNVLRFQNAVMNPNTIGIAGFMIVFLGLSMGHFPLWLGRMSCFIITFAALYEVTTS